MSNLEKLAEIENMLKNQSEEELDVDRILALLAELEGAAPAPHSLHIDVSTKKLRTAVRPAPSTVKRVASIAAAAILCFSLSTISLGQNIINVIFDKNSEQMHVNTLEQTAVPNENALALRSALDEITTDYVPLPYWIPEEFTLDDYEVNNMTNSNHLTAYYVAGKENIDIFISRYDLEATWGSGHEKDIGGKEKTVGGIICYIFTNMGEPMAYWNYGNFEVTMTGNLSLEELDKITNTIK